MENREHTRALALLRAAVVEDQDVITYLLDEGPTYATFMELLVVAAGAMECFHGQERAVQIIDGWLRLALEQVEL